MLAEISSGLSSTKALFDIAKGLQAAATQGQINDIKIALQEHVLNVQAALAAAQTAQFSSAERIRELEQEIVKLKDWECEKQRYELKSIDTGGFAYIPKSGMENGEPPHWLCTNCFSVGQKSILQKRGEFGRDTIWICNACKGTLSAGSSRNPSSPRPGGAA